MSEFTNKHRARLKKLKEVAVMLLDTGNARPFIVKNQNFISTVIPGDFITLFDEIIKEGYSMEEVKILTNRILNIFHIPIRDFERIAPKPGTFLDILEQNNREMELLLRQIRPLYKSYIKNTADTLLHNELLELFTKLEIFIGQYSVKENILFPIIEQTWPDYRCLQIMWSFHDDIRRNIKSVVQQLQNEKIDLKKFNRYVGDVFFNMLAIKFREEHILFPQILSTIGNSQLEKMNQEGCELGFPYVNPDQRVKKSKEAEFEGNMVNLSTGKVSVEQIRLIFNHLPVDITFVDEHNKVCYFSTPSKRIFPRTTAIIGREVKNCHPPESVHVVEQIVESFRCGEKDQAVFWITMKGEFILIQYFAVRDERGNYKGVIEVSQEITGIKALKGEKRLLDW